MDQIKCIKTANGYVRADAIVCLLDRVGSVPPVCCASVHGVIEGSDGWISADVILPGTAEENRALLGWEAVECSKSTT